MTQRQDVASLPPISLPRLDIRPRPREEAVGALEQALSLPRVLCAVLAARGLGDPGEAKAFLRPLLSTLHPPESLTDLPRAVSRIREAIRKGETVFVHGDYDVDGMAGAALLTRWIRRMGGRVVPFIPNRLEDGYDLGPRGLREALGVGATLLVTVDCGILAHEAAGRAAAEGVEVIITDHHTPGSELPPALAVLNPRRSDCPYPNPALSGAGVVFKLCQGLARAEGISEDELHPYLDLVALATIADLVPLTGENRTLARFGLKALARTRALGLRRLLEVAGLNGSELSSGSVAFALAPRLNAMGRMGDGSLALRLLLTEDAAEAHALADRAEAMNRERQAADRKTQEEAFAQLAPVFNPNEDYGIVLAEEGWHPGVVGIVASRVAERVQRPVILVALQGEIGKGSGRSIQGFHLLDAIRGAGRHLEKFGGHRQAAGVVIRKENLDSFRAAFNEEARRRLEGQDLRPSVEVDLEVELRAMTPELVRFMRYLGPHGIGNPRPVFLCRGLELKAPPRVVGANHLKLRLRQGDAELEAIGFNLAERIDPGALGRAPVDVAFQLQEDEYRGIRRLQARLKEIRRSGDASW